jgi:two-component system, NtrC family, nitrogen regulation response regulator GlnG
MNNICKIANLMRRSTATNHVTTFRDTGTSSSVKSGASIALTIAYHPRLDRIGERTLLLGPGGGSLALSRSEPLFCKPGGADGESLDDGRISRKPIFFEVTAAGEVIVDLAQSGTTITIGGQTIAGKVNIAAKDASNGVTLVLGNRIVLLLHNLPPLDDVLTVLDPDIAPEMIGTSIAIRRVLLDVRNVADTNKHVLLRGETGTGKELVAQAIHRVSQRQTSRLVTVNVAGIAETLAEAEFFGSEKGGYTGAPKRIGYFEQASGGTLFLDEIGDIPSSIQPKLLRALENGELQPVGSEKPRKVDVRIISATDANLDEKVATRGFSEALRQRLKGYEIWIPPLRERREDIGLLVAHFLRGELVNVGEAQRLDVPPDGKPWLSASIVAQLIDYDWPGNVRELKHIIGQIVVGNRGRLRAELPPAMVRLFERQTPCIKPQSANVQSPAVVVEAPHEPAIPPIQSSAPIGRRKPAEVNEQELRDALRLHRWDLNATSEYLGISRASMYVLKERHSWFRVAGDLQVDEIRACHEACKGNLRQMAERLEVSEPALKRRIKELGLKLEV